MVLLKRVLDIAKSAQSVQNADCAHTMSECIALEGDIMRFEC